MLVSVALVATLLVLLLARDVARSAHGATGPRRSENRSFALMVNGLVVEQNDLDARLTFLLTRDAGLSRAVFTARLDQLAHSLSGWSEESALLRRPVLAHDVNTVVAELTEQRVDDYQVVLDSIASSLQLPWTRLSVSPATGAFAAHAAQASLAATSAQWNQARWSLAREPGRARMNAMTSYCAQLSLSRALAKLASSTSLALRREVVIGAVALSPSPLPAPVGELVLPPVSSVHVGVSVINLAFAYQPVHVVVTLSPSGPLGLVQRRSMSVTLGPKRSFAFAPSSFTTSAGEHAVLSVTVSGAPGPSVLSRSRTYRVTMAPSGAG